MKKKKSYEKPSLETITISDNLLLTASEETVSLRVDLEESEDEGLAE